MTTLLPNSDGSHNSVYINNKKIDRCQLDSSCFLCLKCSIVSRKEIRKKMLKVKKKAHKPSQLSFMVMQLRYWTFAFWWKKIKKSWWIVIKNYSQSMTKSTPHDFAFSSLWNLKILLNKYLIYHNPSFCSLYGSQQWMW